MGYFYQPPPTFIGGAQPYAPRLGIVQGGPAPQAPPPRGAVALATLGVILSAWQPPFFEAQGAGDIAPLIQTTAAPSGPPVVTGVILRSIVDQWQPGWYGPPQTRTASILPIVNSAPPRTSVNLSTVLQSWQPPFLESQGGSEIAPLLPAAPVASQPPGLNRTLAIITSNWSADQTTLIYLDSIAPFATPPAISQPQPISRVNLQVALQSWQTPFFLAQGAGDIAPTLPAPPVISPPPPSARVTLMSIITARWYFDERTIVPLTSIAAFAAAPEIDQPQPISRVNLQIALQGWQLPFFEAQGAGDIAPLIAALVPPSQPSPTGRATFNLIVRAWDPPVWWPLPANGPIAQTATVTNAPLPSSGVNLRVLVDAWRPAPYAIPVAGDLAPLLPAPTLPSNPPPSSGVTYSMVIQSWQPPVWWPLPRLTLSVQLPPVVGVPRNPDRLVLGDYGKRLVI